MQHEASESLFGDAMFQAVVEVARAIGNLADEHQRHHMTGRPEIPISEEHLAVLLEYRFTIRAIATCSESPPGQSGEGLSSMAWIKTYHSVTSVIASSLTLPISLYTHILSQVRGPWMDFSGGLVLRFTVTGSERVLQGLIQEVSGID